MTRLAEIATLVHGYTMADIDQCSAVAVAKTRTKMSAYISHDDMHFFAWHGIVVRLYDHEQYGTDKPEWHELLNAGIVAILKEQTAERSTHGRDSAHPGQTAPRFALYWNMEEQSSRPPRMIRAHGGTIDTDFTDKIVERMALPVALGALSDIEYEVIATLAAHDGSRENAAAALGISLTTFKTRISKARAHFAEVWTAPDTPRAKRTLADQQDPNGSCPAGHLRAQHATLDARGTWVCLPCKRGAGRRAERRRRQRAKEAVAA